MFHPSDSRVALVGDNFKPGSGVHNPAFHDAEAPPNYHWVLEDEKTRTSETGGDLSWRKIRDALRNGCCTRTAWRRRLPISYWLPKYSWLDFRGDMVAGLTVGLTVVPQGLAYAQIARVPLEYGLYSAFMGCFAYTVFGTAKDITLGPTAVLSLMTGASFPKSASESDRAHYAILLSFFVGIVQLILAVFNLGFLVDFISAPVISGFTTASAFLILYAQIKTLTGLSFSADNLIDHTEGYIRTIKSVKYGRLLFLLFLFFNTVSKSSPNRFADFLQRVGYTDGYHMLHSPPLDERSETGKEAKVEHPETTMEYITRSCSYHLRHPLCANHRGRHRYRVLRDRKGIQGFVDREHGERWDSDDGSTTANMGQSNCNRPFQSCWITHTDDSPCRSSGVNRSSQSLCVPVPIPDRADARTLGAGTLKCPLFVLPWVPGHRELHSFCTESSKWGTDSYGMHMDGRLRAAGAWCNVACVQIRAEGCIERCHNGSHPDPLRV
ncbi:hypothetical protein RvY_07913-2 [Ramazzottius varieornatus]|uniref:SLC26A/SulP transporter domain-containing protein n=1 Tax=Ramazzottius varieornatus TaxID=947166 RepID=A0A1D1V6R8_RAMVA|nr:hypothetical protein RvY_07913-2 [Ramazzottius varieornatus]